MRAARADATPLAGDERHGHRRPVSALGCNCKSPRTPSQSLCCGDCYMPRVCATACINCFRFRACEGERTSYSDPRRLRSLWTGASGTVVRSTAIRLSRATCGTGPKRSPETKPVMRTPTQGCVTRVGAFSDIGSMMIRRSPRMQLQWRFGERVRGRDACLEIQATSRKPVVAASVSRFILSVRPV